MPDEAMTLDITIDKTGKIITEVIDRGSHLCSNAYKLTNSLGRQLSDEETGPECPSTVHQTT